MLKILLNMILRFSEPAFLKASESSAEHVKLPAGHLNVFL